MDNPICSHDADASHDTSMFVLLQLVKPEFLKRSVLIPEKPLRDSDQKRYFGYDNESFKSVFIIDPIILPAIMRPPATLLDPT